MIAAQLFFTFFVKASNTYLYNNLIAMQQAGYHLLVPNTLVMPTLQEWAPAVYGGLFFTLTVGAGLSLMGWFGVYLWRIFPRLRWIIAGSLLLFSGYVLINLNSPGVNLPITFICMLIPAISGFVALQFYAGLCISGNFRIPVVHMAVIVMIGMIWMPKVNADVFTTIRDSLLLTNPTGQKINDFYYKYTLYPAEAFKSLDQKQLKTVNIKIPDNGLSQRIESRLLKEDYFPVAATHPADIVVIQENNRILFQNNGRTVHISTISEFFASPSDHLTTVSQKSDYYHFFRKMTFIGLIAASPLICYMILHTVLTILLFPIPSVVMRSGCAATACLLATGIAALPLYIDASPPAPSEISRYLESDRWQDRVSALKCISNDDIPIDGLNELFRLVDSPWTAERYWLAKSLSNSRSPKTGQLALILLNDPQPNVECMALFSLGNRNQPAAIPEIQRKMASSDHWYVQWYGYKALKRLGWKQQIGQEQPK
ncbi:MAG: HEAT repeat domain-containing protein [Desulfobacteraceae bacterium]|nr:MAG: HEAT repeat domain-containing protein [Desulfobacteraceae bacterium]